MNYFRLLILSVAIIVAETLILTILATFAGTIFSPLIYINYEVPEFKILETIAGGGAMLLYFIFYRLIFELGPFLLLMLLFSFFASVRLRDMLVVSKIIASIPCLLVLGSFSSGIRAPVDYFMISAILWYPAIVTSYFIFKKWYIKGIEWAGFREGI